ncbi:MAG: uracil-DNA glycosylase [Pelagibacterales bacterium]|nr:uracil-DNA glycosylase [Pelagibacterales bacterium]
MQKLNNKSLLGLNKKIINCNSCERLLEFRNKIAKEKRKMYRNENYWGKPITGFGDIKAKIMIIGLAPAAHGGNRTGRVFTGDKSSDFLFECLGNIGLANQNYSINKNDGLKLLNTYLTLSLKCVPPGDKPTKQELLNCSKFLKEEFLILQNVKAIVALGKIAFDSILFFYKKNFIFDAKGINFSHGHTIDLPDNKKLIACYHPSPRNVNTGRINLLKFTNLFKQIIMLVS